MTTAMSILPHTDIERALALVLTLDIPFWPQLPRASFYHDMYAQASYDFPGVTIEPGEGKIRFNTAKFMEELGRYSDEMANPDGFSLSGDYGSAYRKFLACDLQDYPAIHGQMTGPVNLGFRINDENGSPLVYNEQVRALMFDFVQRKYLTQLRQLREKNRNAFVWLDEPGLVWVFSGLSGYNDIKARQDYHELLREWEGLKALHLCSNINLPYLLGLGLDFLSFDAYQLGVMPRDYAPSAAEFLGWGGIISWGIVPTEPAVLKKETPETLLALLLGYWDVISRNAGIAMEQIAAQSLVAPAKCCVKSMDFSSRGKETAATESCSLMTEEQSVEQAYTYLKWLSSTLRDKFGFC